MIGSRLHRTWLARIAALIVVFGAIVIIVRPDPRAQKIPIGADGEVVGVPSVVLMPDDGRWNGDFVVYAHAYNDPDTEISAPDPRSPDDFRDRLLSAGFGYAASAFSKGGYAIAQGMAETATLTEQVLEARPETRHVYVVGDSAGGLIAIGLLEQRPDLYSGGVAVCALADGWRAYSDQLFGFRVLLDYYFPDNPLGRDALVVPESIREAWNDDSVTAKPVFDTMFRSDLDKTAEMLRVAGVQYDPNNPDTIALSAMALTSYVVVGTADILTTAGGNPFDNSDRRYAGSRDDTALNAGVQRLHADSRAAEYVGAHYTPTGALQRPLVELHSSVDPVAPSWWSVRYADRVESNGDESNLLTVIVPDYGHCVMDPREPLLAFSALVNRVEGRAPTFAPPLDLSGAPWVSTFRNDGWREMIPR